MHWGGYPDSLNGSFHRHPPHFRNFNSGFLPYWYDEPFWYESSNVEPAPVIVMMSPEKRQPPREIPAAKPQIIEVPGVAKLAPARPLPPTIFVLTNGERLEARRYLLTADNLYVTIDRQQRVVPLGLIDLNASVANNRARGIDLRVPADRHEISVGF